jgi:hypothetical protein
MAAAKTKKQKTKSNPNTHSTTNIMKTFQTQTKALLLAAVAGSLLMTGGSVKADNANYVAGDLILFFQNPGGSQGSTQELYVNLGNTATVFRQDYVDQANSLGLTNIAGLLSSTYGNNWANEVTLFGGLGGVWGTSNLSSALQNGDPHRTIYTSSARNSTGAVGSANTTAYSIGTDTNMSGIANSISAVGSAFDNGSGQAIALTTTVVATQNPSAGPNSWNNNIPGTTVQQQGSGSSFGTFGSVSNVEFMWDLYRIEGKSGVAGSFDDGLAVRNGLYLGTVTLNSAGDVSFQTVPEPSSALLCGLGLAVVLYSVRRSRTAQELA